MSMLGLRDLVLIAQTPSLHQHQQQGQPISGEHHGNLPLPSSASLSVGLGIFPLLTTTPCMSQQHPNHINDVHQGCGGNTTSINNNNNYWNLKMCPEVNNSARKGVMINVEEDESSKHMMGSEENDGIYGGGEFRVCQDCGNRAKKDCIFRRCRTCCKGRGYDCNTHVKSTWVPPSHKRDREVAVVAGGGGGGGDGDDGVVKRPRVSGSSQNAATNSHSSTSNATTTKSFDISSYHQDAAFKESLPSHVRAPAEFRCHRMSAIGNGEDEVSYLATVHISGHVFKGFLYDHGIVGKNEIPNVSVLQLGNNGSGKNNRECSSAIEVPTSAYPASAC